VAEHVLEREQVVARPLSEVFAFFADARNLERLTPPWLRFQILTRGAIEMAPGARIEYRLRLHGVPVRWVTLIETWDELRSFTDLQQRGPYRRWHHTHTFSEHAQGTLVGDRVRYELPLGPLGELAHALFVRRDLERVFEYRRETIARLLA
jgi:ligand-binding SRPBCC domain-containing protein